MMLVLVVSHFVSPSALLGVIFGQCFFVLIVFRTWLAVFVDDKDVKLARISRSHHMIQFLLE